MRSVAASLLKRSISAPIAAASVEIRCVAAEFAELMLEVLLGLRRDIPISPFPLEFGDELSGYAHLAMIGEFASQQ